MRAIGFFVATSLGIACTWTGIWLRLKAHDLAWPQEWGYSGPREDTIWAIRECAYHDISLAILGFGLLLLAIVLFDWLRARSIVMNKKRHMKHAQYCPRHRTLWHDLGHLNCRRIIYEIDIPSLSK